MSHAHHPPPQPTSFLRGGCSPPHRASAVWVLLPRLYFPLLAPRDGAQPAGTRHPLSVPLNCFFFAGGRKRPAPPRPVLLSGGRLPTARVPPPLKAGMPLPHSFFFLPTHYLHSSRVLSCWPSRESLLSIPQESPRLPHVNQHCWSHMGTCENTSLCFSMQQIAAPATPIDPSPPLISSHLLSSLRCASCCRCP